MKKTVLIISLLLGVHVAAAQSSFQASLVPDVAIVPRGENVRGVALNIWGENQVNGLSLGFVNGLVGESSGLSLSFLGTYAEDYTGVIWGNFVAYSSGDVVGWQAGLVNVNTGSFVGLQSGFINVGNQTKGLQLGFVNYTENLQGVQLGLINVALNNPWFSDFPQKLATGFPFVNWSF
ncbi:MAG TPA: hypothetical protein VK041_05845 [Opitutales bacterium]|nr:hypothetical protein [Opitutales bacterium]